jgi:hypothetical protein
MAVIGVPMISSAARAVEYARTAVIVLSSVPLPGGAWDPGA